MANLPKLDLPAVDEAKFSRLQFREVVSLDNQASEAFRKASHDLVKKAEQSGTEVFIWRDDAVVNLSPAEAAALLEAEAVSSAK